MLTSPCNSCRMIPVEGWTRHFIEESRQSSLDLSRSKSHIPYLMRRLEQKWLKKLASYCDSYFSRLARNIVAPPWNRASPKMRRRHFISEAVLRATTINDVKLVLQQKFLQFLHAGVYLGSVTTGSTALFGSSPGIVIGGGGGSSNFSSVATGAF